MNKKKILSIGAVVFIIGASVAAYLLFFQPNRDTQAVESAFTISSEELVNNCLTDLQKTNEKLLSDDGESEVFIVTGKVASTEKDQNGQTTIYLSAGEGKPLVRCTLLKDTDASAVKAGDDVKVKGVFRSCAEYDEDLDLMEDAIIDQGALVN